MLEYAANGSAFWVPEQLRAWFEGDDSEAATGHLAAWLDSADDDAEEVSARFWDAVGTNLREGKIRLVFVADEIPATLQRLVEFLNEQMPRVEVLAVEVRQYRAAGSKSGALVSRVVGQTSRAQAAKQRPVPAERRPVRWTADEVLEQIAQAGQDEAVMASTIRDWAEKHPYLQVTGGTGVSYPSIMMSADSGRAQLRHRTPPYHRVENRERLLADLKTLGIPRLNNEDLLADKRPNIPLGQLTGGRAESLLSLVDRWIEDIRTHAAEPEPADES
jgi:hypothetical protein